MDMTPEDLAAMQKCEDALGKAFDALEAGKFSEITDATSSMMRRYEFIGCMMYLQHGYSGPRAAAIRKHQEKPK